MAATTELFQLGSRAIVLLTAIPVHEAAHALVAWRLGDPTAKDAGRLSLNPARHFRVIGKGDQAGLVDIALGFMFQTPADGAIEADDGCAIEGYFDHVQRSLLDSTRRRSGDLRRVRVKLSVPSARLA